jgi:hypothetical protein
VRASADDPLPQNSLRATAPGVEPTVPHGVARYVRAYRGVILAFLVHDVHSFFKLMKPRAKNVRGNYMLLATGRRQRCSLHRAATQ